MKLQYNIIQSNRRRKMHKKESRFSVQSGRYNQQVKDFLSKFKVVYCTISEPHYYQYCQHYHGLEDRRRNPYKGHNLAYYPTNPICTCTNENCNGSHNQYEYYFHPFNYRTTLCSNGHCNIGLICYNAHQNQIPFLQKNAFFRFDLQTFKIYPCQTNHSNNSEYASCRFYHGDGDRRRDHTQMNYSHLQCVNKANCLIGQCQYSHNKIEQLYHPQRYKSKYCSKTLKGNYCQYLQFCSFAHRDEQITIQLLHKISPQDQHFLTYKFKTVWCPYTQNHDRSTCPYAHNFNDYRRDPIRFKYEIGECPYWIKSDSLVSIDDCGCPYKLDCNKCHGWFQNKYHVTNMLKSNQGGQQERNNLRIETPKNIQSLRNEDGFGTGAPFYKIEQKKESRPKSKKHEKQQEKSEPKETNGQEEMGQISSPKRKTSSRKSYSTVKGVKNNKKGKDAKGCLFFYLQQDGKVWLSSSSSEKSIKKSPNGSRKKSLIVNKSQSNKASYTDSFKKIIAHYGLQQKIMSLGIHQYSLLNLTQEEITNEEQFSQLTTSEKQNLIRAISKYNQDPAHLKYSDSFKSIFKRRQQQGILQKLHTKRITQKKLLDLSQSSIKQLSFLGQQQRQKLPVILQNYIEEHRDFKEINEMIKNQTDHPQT